MADETTTTTTTETTETQETPWQTGIFDPEKPGKFVQAWQEKLGAEFENDKSMLASYGDLDTVLKSLAENKRKAREKAGAKPITAESTPEQVKEFRQIFGIPEEPYKFDEPEKLPDGVEWRDDRMSKFGQWAHEKNLTPAQAKDAMGLYMEFVAEDAASMKKAQSEQHRQWVEAEKEALETEYGGKLPREIQNAQRAALALGLNPSVVDPDSPEFGVVRPSAILKMASEIARLKGESQLPTSESIVNMTPEREYRSIVNDKSNPLHQLWAKGDPHTVQRVNELRRLALQRQ